MLSIFLMYQFAIHMYFLEMYLCGSSDHFLMGLGFFLDVELYEFFVYFGC